MQTYESGYKSTLSQPLEAADTTMYVATVPTVTKGRIYLTNGQQEEWISFTGVSGSTLTGLTRGLSQTADPATAGTGLRWIAGTPIALVAMHDQMVDKEETTTFTDINFEGTTTGGLKVKSLTTTQRNALTAANGMIIYNTTAGEFQIYQGGAWSTMASGSTQPDASTTVAGKVELGTAAQLTAGTTTGETGAALVVTPDLIQASIQKGEALYCGASSAGSDTYAVTATPALTSYTTGQSLIFKADVANTGACTVNVNALGAKSIKTLDGNDPQTGAIRANQFVRVIYDGTNMVIQNEDFATTSNRGVNEIATDAEASAITGGTDETRTINSKQLKGWDGYSIYPTSTTTPVGLLQSADTERTSTSLTYVKIKEIVATVAGTYTVSFDLAENVAQGGVNAFGRIYKNGVAFGTEQTTADTTYETKIEDLTFAAGDLIQLYVKQAASSNVKVRNFRLYGYIKPSSLTLTVNTD